MSFLIYFILLAIVAEILGTIGGFGSSLFFVPIAGLFFDFHSVLGITALFHLSSNISKIVLFKEGINKHLVILVGIPSVIFVILGAWLSKYFNGNLLEILLAFFLIAIGLVLLVFRKFSIKASSANCIAGGFLSGAMAGLVGTGGAVRGIVLSAFNLKKEIFIATSAVIDLGIDFSRSIIYTANGYVHKHDLYLVPILLVVSIVGTFAGKKILYHIPQSAFKNIVVVLIIAIGIFTLVNIALH
jgi:uncharacterized membrane protein YfcA